MQMLPLAQLRESPHNPRKHFDPAQLAELTASVARSGVLEPVIVRALHPPAKGKSGLFAYELASGHRRFRAAQAVETYGKMFGVDIKALVKAAQPKGEKPKIEKPKGEKPKAAPAKTTKAARTAKVA